MSSGLTNEKKLAQRRAGGEYPASRKSKCKGPEAGMCLAGGRNKREGRYG